MSVISLLEEDREKNLLIICRISNISLVVQQKAVCVGGDIKLLIDPIVPELCVRVLNVVEYIVKLIHDNDTHPFIN